MFDWDRTIRLRFKSVDDLLTVYKLKPKPPRRVVAILELQDGESPNLQTIKSLMDQNFRLHDIAIQCNNPMQFKGMLEKLVTFHKPNTEWLRETEKDTLVLYIQNGKEYPYGFIDDAIN